MKHMNIKQFRHQNIAKQSGAALIITIAVMLAMTVLAVAATNSNQTQSFLVRNAQFRLETFNASSVEIDGRIDAINNTSLAADTPAFLRGLIDADRIGGFVGVTSSPVDSDLIAGNAVNAGNFDLVAPAPATYMSQETQLVFREGCNISGLLNNDLTESNRTATCYRFQVNADSDLVGRESIQSNQSQVFDYILAGE